MGMHFSELAEHRLSVPGQTSPRALRTFLPYLLVQHCEEKVWGKPDFNASLKAIWCFDLNLVWVSWNYKYVIGYQGFLYVYKFFMLCFQNMDEPVLSPDHCHFLAQEVCIIFFCSFLFNHPQHPLPRPHPHHLLVLHFYVSSFPSILSLDPFICILEVFPPKD